MTFLDDSLVGTGAMRSVKIGSKSAGFASTGDGAMNGAFENAIADAGKKKPMAAPSGATDGGEGLTTNIETSRQSLAEKAAKASSAVPLQNGLLKEDAPKPARPQKTVSAAGGDRIAVAKVDAEPSPAGMEPGKAEGAAAHPSMPSMGKILELVKDAKPIPAKPLDASEAKSTESRGKVRGPSSNDADDAATIDDAENSDAGAGDVSQLLALLGASKQQAVAAASVPATASVSTTSTSFASEFQALADRAGKARTDGRQANTGAGMTGQAQGAGDANAVSKATEAGTDQIFRFARADGKGQAFSMTLNTDGDKPSAKIDASPAKADAAANGRAETVTVLDSRRYLGVAANTNSQAVAVALTGSTEWARAMQPSSGLSSPEAASAAGKVVNTLKIQMHPIDLGTVTATLRLKDDELHVELKVESGEAFRQLSDDQNAMVKALRAQGFAVDEISITFNAPSDTAAGNTGSQQPQAGQQGGRDASGGSAAQGGSRNDNSSQQQSGDRWTGNDGTDEASAVSEHDHLDHTYM